MLEKKYSQLFGNFVTIPFSWLPLLSKNALLLLSFLVYKTSIKDGWFRAGTKKDVQERLLLSRFQVDNAIKELLDKQYIHLKTPKRKKHHLVGIIKVEKLQKDCQEHLDLSSTSMPKPKPKPKPKPPLTSYLVSKAIQEKQNKELMAKVLKHEQNSEKNYTVTQIIQAVETEKKLEGMTKEEEEIYNAFQKNFALHMAKLKMLENKQQENDLPF